MAIKPDPFWDLVALSRDEIRKMWHFVSINEVFYLLRGSDSTNRFQFVKNRVVLLVFWTHYAF
jgi:hypothetical protein